MNARGLPKIASCLGCGSVNASLMRSIDKAFCFYVACSCGFQGPPKSSQRLAILAWKPRAGYADAKKRGAQEEREHLRNEVSLVLESWGVQHAEEIIQEIFGPVAVVRRKCVNRISMEHTTD